MMSELFVRDARELAQPRDFSAFSPLWGEYNHPSLSNITSVNLGAMLAQVRLEVSSENTSPSFRVYGDPAMCEALDMSVRGNCLMLNGALPYTEEDAPTLRLSGRRSPWERFAARFGRRSRFVIITDSGLIVNERPVDLDRQLLIVLTVPQQLTLEVTENFFGLVAVAGGRIDHLNLFTHTVGQVYVDEARHMSATNYQSGMLDVGTTTEYLKLTNNGDGEVFAELASGEVHAAALDLGSITIAEAYGIADLTTRSAGEARVVAGKLRTLNCLVGDTGNILCSARVKDSACLTTTPDSFGDITLNDFGGHLEYNLQGLGNAYVNGRVYEAHL